MLASDISRDLKSKIEANQIQMREAIRKHQKLMERLKEGDVRHMKQLQDLIEEAQQHIIIIGLEQKGLVDRLRKEYKQYQRNFKANAIKNGIEDRRINLSNSLARARKQNMSATVRPVSLSDSPEIISSVSTPEPLINYPLNPQDLCQTDFLTYFGLATHEVFREIQNKRAERKRRRTANPQFLYSRGFDVPKRKRKTYLASNISPPNTRQSSKNRRAASPCPKTAQPTSPETKKLFPHPWPSGLTIEPVKVDADEAQVCTECNKPDNLLTCEICASSFHVSCHNRPLNQTPKHCPKCLKTVLAHEADLNEKLALRTQLVDKNKHLVGELSTLQDQHSELEISLKTQDTRKKELLRAQDTIEYKVNALISFALHIKDSDFNTPFKGKPFKPQSAEIDLTEDCTSIPSPSSTAQSAIVDDEVDEEKAEIRRETDCIIEKMEVTAEEEKASDDGAEVLETSDLMATLQDATAERVENINDDMPAPVLLAEAPLLS